MIRSLFILMIAVSLYSCRSKTGEILGRDKMQAVLWDILQADAFTEQFIKIDSLKNPALENAKLQQRIFSIHKITKTDFDRSYDYYREHPDEMRILLDSITVVAERSRKDMMMRKYSKPIKTK